MRDSGHNLQQVLTKDSTLTKENMIITSMKGLCSLKDVIIENGIKYGLYLLYHYLFDTISWIFLGSKEHIDEIGTGDENQNCRKQGMENNNSNGKPLIEPQNAEKDSDSSRNQSNNGSNETPMNCKNIDSCISHTALKNPMDISSEEHSFNKTQFPINISQDTEPFANKRSDVIRNKFQKSFTQQQHSNFFVNKGNARIFNQKFTSSDNMHWSSSFPRSSASYKYKKSKQTDFFYNGEDNRFSNNSLTRPSSSFFYNGEDNRFSNNFLTRPWLKKKETEQRKKLSIKFAPTNEKKNFIFDEEKDEKYTEQTNGKKIQEEKRNFRRHGPTKYNSHYSKAVGNKKSKRNNLKHKEMGTQTDSAFSTDNAVEMVSVGTMCPEREIYANATHRSQDRNMNQEVNYILNQDLTKERLLSAANQLITFYSNTLPSSTDPSSNEHTCSTPDNNIAADQWSTKLINSINTSETPTRAPPGFSEVPQSPPAASSTYNSEYIMLPSLKDEYNPHFRFKPVTVAPPAPSAPPAPPAPPAHPAPSHVRHLYYD